MTAQKNDANIPTPDMTLNMMDNIYLAIVWSGAQGKPAPMALTHIYMLLCPRVNETQFALNPETRVATFANVRDAEIYYKTVLAAQQFQQKMRAAKMLARAYEDDIEKFKQRVR